MKFLYTKLSTSSNYDDFNGFNGDRYFYAGRNDGIYAGKNDGTGMIRWDQVNGDGQTLPNIFHEDITNEFSDLNYGNCAYSGFGWDSFDSHGLGHGEDEDAIYWRLAKLSAFS